MGLQDICVETVVTILRSLDVQDMLNLRCVCRKHHTALAAETNQTHRCMNFISRLHEPDRPGQHALHRAIQPDYE